MKAFWEAIKAFFQGLTTPAAVKKTFRYGDTGPEVRTWMVKLKVLGFYKLGIDEKFGAGMQTAVRAAQAEAGFEVTGILDVDLMEYLNVAVTKPVVPVDPVKPPAAESGTRLEIALTKITGKFEGKGFDQVSGDFDGQGISVGVLQWNFGQGSLQTRILAPYLARYGSIDALGIFPMDIDHLARSGPTTALAWTRKNMLDNGSLKAAWRTAWVKFMGSERVIELQLGAAAGVEASAEKMMLTLGLTSLRAFCWCFDIVTQNGSLSGVSKMDPSRINAKAEVLGWNAGSDSGAADFAKNRTMWIDMLDLFSDEQVSLLRTTIARAKKSNAKWDTDVLNRKGTIAMGAGWVHGTKCDFNHILGSSVIQDPPRTLPNQEIGAGLEKLAMAKGINVALVTKAIEFQKRDRPDKNPQHWAVFEIMKHSKLNRFHVFDRVNQTVESFPVAHGSGSDPDHDGFATIFKNVSGSHCSSKGVYRCAETYVSAKNGISLRLDGKEATNDKARERLVVIHGSKYTEPSYIAQNGKSGRSQGCPAVPMSQAKRIIEKLAGGSLLVIG